MAESPVRPDTSGPAAIAGQRRGFFARLAAIVIGGVVGLFPFVSGLAVFLDPLRRRGANGHWVRLTTLDALPDDGVPRQFNVVLPQKDDAWTRTLRVPVGSAYLVRQPGSSAVSAFNATCPHAGCLIAYLDAARHFGCPCHKSEFGLDGRRTDAAASPSPRDMDRLECEVRSSANASRPEVWVHFENFQIATSEKRLRV